ncbi:MAG: hypothetical protein ACP5OK_09805, partial [Thermoprotei archaeon]
TSIIVIKILSKLIVFIKLNNVFPPDIYLTNFMETSEYLVISKPTSPNALTITDGKIESNDPRKSVLTVM